MAAFLSGDAITLVLETVPLYLLFELSLLVAASGEAQRRGEPGREHSGLDAASAGRTAASRLHHRGRQTRARRFTCEHLCFWGSDV